MKCPCANKTEITEIIHTANEARNYFPGCSIFFVFRLE